MKRRLRRLAAVALVVIWLVIALTGLASSDGKAFVWLACIALTPMVFAAFVLLPDAFRAGTPEGTVGVVAAPLTAVCMALSFFLLATVVGGTLWGWPGGVAGGALGTLLGVQILVAMSYVRHAVSAAPSPPTQAASRKVLAAAALSAGGFALSLLLLGGFGYVLFGLTGAVVLVCFTGLAVTFAVGAGFHARSRREKRS